MMGSPEEGIYASSVLANTSIQETDHGLTLSPKILPEDVLFFDDTCVLGDDGFEDVLVQEQSLSGELDEDQVPSSSPWYHANLLDDLRPAKRRKTSSIDQGALTSQDAAIDTMDEAQPLCPKTCLPGSLERLAIDRHSSPEKECVVNGREKSLTHEVHQADDTVAHLKHISPRTQSSYPLEENEYRSSYPPLHAKECKLQDHDCGRITPGLVDSVPNPVKEKRISQNRLTSLDVERPGVGRYYSDSVCSVNKSSGIRILDPDMPLPSIERAYREAGGAVSLKGSIGSKRIKYMSKAKVAAFGLASGLFRAPRRTVTHATSLPRSHARNDTSKGQDLDAEPHSLLRAPQQPPTRSYLPDTPQEASTPACRPGSCPVHEIPPQLRRQFDTLVKKYYSDQDFKLSVQSYMTEQNISDALGKRHDMTGTMQSGETCSFAENHVSSTGNIIHDATKDLIGCPVEEVLSKYNKLITDYLKLQKNELYLRHMNADLHAAVNYYQPIAATKSRAQYHRPDEPMPHDTKWKCSDKKANGRACGKWNEPYMPHAIWVEREHCMKCGIWRGVGDRASVPVMLPHQNYVAPSPENQPGVAFTQHPQDTIGSDTPMSSRQYFMPNMGMSFHGPDGPAANQQDTRGFVEAPDAYMTRSGPHDNAANYSNQHDGNNFVGAPDVDMSSHSPDGPTVNQHDTNNFVEATDVDTSFYSPDGLAAYYSNQHDTNNFVGAPNTNMSLSEPHDHASYHTNQHDTNSFVEPTATTGLVDKSKAATPLSTKGVANTTRATTKKVISKKASKGKALQKKVTEAQTRSVATTNGALQNIFQKSKKPWEESTTTGRSSGREVMVISDSPVSSPTRSLVSLPVPERSLDDEMEEEVPIDEAGYELDRAKSELLDMGASSDGSFEEEMERAFALFDAEVEEPQI